MAFEDLKNAILNDAKNICDNNIAVAKEKALAIICEAEKKGEERKNELIAEAEKNAEQALSRAEFTMLSKVQSRVLSDKTKILDDVYIQASKNLAELAVNEYKKLIIALLKTLPVDLTGELFTNFKLRDILVEAVNESGKSYVVSKEPISCLGGFIFKSKQIEIDQRFESIVHEMRGDTVLKLVNILFEPKS